MRLVVTCPFCQEKGRIPETFIGKQIRCGKCNNKFMLTPPPAKGARAEAASPAAAAAATSAPGRVVGVHEIAVEGLDDQAWSSDSPTATAAEAEPGHGTEAQGVFTASHADHPTDMKEYKLLTQRDKWFEGKYDLARLEEAINFYARQGWKVKAMTPAQVKQFSGALQEEVVVLLER